jgi:hypothetical protein
MTLRQLKALALRYTPRRARFSEMWWNEKGCEWVPAHELAHAFVARSEQLTQRRFGLHRTQECNCRNRACLVFEACAMELSGAWVTACGRPDVRDHERTERQTPGISLVQTPGMRRRMIRRLRKLELWPVPTTLEALKAFAEKKGLRA